MRFYIVNVEPHYPTEVALSWVLEDPDGELGANVEVTVERSGSPEGPFENISGPVIDAVFFADDSFSDPDNEDQINLLSLNRSIYYRIRAEGAEGVAETQAVSLDNVMVPFPETPIPAVGYRINEKFQPIIDPISFHTSLPDDVDRHQILLRRKLLRENFVYFKLTGVTTYVFKRKHWGTNCVCKDPLTKGQTLYDCDACYGTGWVGGFYTPVETRVVFREAPVSFVVTPQGPVSQMTTVANMMVSPKVEADDVLVEKTTNRRWLVKQPMSAELKRLATSQRVQVAELSRDSMEYRLPIS